MDPNQNNNQPPNPTTSIPVQPIVGQAPANQVPPVAQNPNPVVVQPTANSAIPTNPYTHQPISPQPVDQSNQLFAPDPYNSYAKVDSGQNKLLGILSIVFAVIGLAPIGLVLGIIGLKKAKTYGQKNMLALVGTILSAVFTLISIAVIIILVSVTSSTLKKCNELGPGTHQLSATSTITCGSGAASSSNSNNNSTTDTNTTDTTNTNNSSTDKIY